MDDNKEDGISTVRKIVDEIAIPAGKEIILPASKALGKFLDDIEYIRFMALATPLIK